MTLAADGTLSGKPTLSGDANFTITATGLNNPAISGSAVYELQILPILEVLDDGKVGILYRHQGREGVRLLTYDSLVGAFPPGFDLYYVGSRMMLGGTPTTAGIYSFRLIGGGSVDREYRVTILPADPISLSPSAGALPSAIAGTAYAQSITATGGSGAYSFAVTDGALPAGLALASDGALSGTPTTAGPASFTITATDTAIPSITGTAAYVLEVAPAVLPADATLGALSLNTGTLSPAFASGTTSYTATVPNATDAITVTPTANEANATIIVNGTAVVSGNASDAIALSLGVNTITILVTAEDGTSTQTYTVTVIREGPADFIFTPSGGELPQAMAGEDYRQQISATGGTGPLIYGVTSGNLPPGMALNVSTGELTGPLDVGSEGPYSFTIQVTDAHAIVGTASYTLLVNERAVTVTDKEVTVAPGATPANVNLENGATGGPFVSAEVVAVEPANGGTAQIVMGEFAQAGGPAPVSFYLKFTPNPAYSGQVTVRFTLTSSLGTSNTGIVAYNLGYDPVAVAQEIDGLVHGFVQTRQSLIASTIKVPGLLERRRMEAAGDPVIAHMTPSADGVTLGFATSLAQMEAARNQADGIVATAHAPFNVWIDGTFMVHNREQNGNRWGSFGMISAGADYLLSEQALLGLSFHYDRMTDPTDADAQLTGNGWLAGPYASFELGKGVFWDTSLLYGESSNHIDTAFWDGGFDTRRWLFDTSITGQWQLDAVTVFTPRLRAVYLNETVDSYVVENGNGDQIVLDGFSTEQLRVSLGAEIARQLTLEDGSVLTPTLGLTGGFSGLNGSGAFAQISTGFTYQAPDAWTLNGGLLFNIDGSAQMSVGAKAGLGVRF